MTGPQSPSAAGDRAIFTVPDMSCAHCVGTIKGALESALPGAVFAIDLDAKRVTVPANAAAVAEAAMRDAGYEPERNAA